MVASENMGFSTIRETAFATTNMAVEMSVTQILVFLKYLEHQAQKIIFTLRPAAQLFI